MKMGQIWRWLLVLITAVALALALILGPINILARDLGFMERGFEKYNVPAVTGLSMDQLRSVARDIIAYWDNDQPLLTTEVQKNGQTFPVFGGPTNKQTLHMRDVKALFQMARNVWIGSLVVLMLVLAWSIVNARHAGLKVFARGILSGSVLVLAILALLGIAATSNFDQFWTTFHLISFSNDEWMLDPRTDYLIMMFPEPFWYDAVFWIVGWAAGLAVALAILSAISLRVLSGRQPEAAQSPHPITR